MELHKVYKEGKLVAKLYLGDCLDVMPKLKSKSIDLICTDPPYSLKYEFANDSLSHSEQQKFMKQYCKEFVRMLKDYGTLNIFMGQKMTHYLYFVLLDLQFTWQNELIWNRDGGQMPTKKLGICHEIINIWTKGENHKTFNLDEIRMKSKYAETDKRLNPKGKNPGDVWYVPALFGRKKERIVDENGKAIHPTQKPIDIIYPLIKAYSNEDDSILDAFMGSGTTGEVAIKLGRRFIGIEKDEKYFDIACKRLENL